MSWISVNMYGYGIPALCLEGFWARNVCAGRKPCCWMTVVDWRFYRLLISFLFGKFCPFFDTV